MQTHHFPIKFYAANLIFSMFFYEYLTNLWLSAEKEFSHNPKVMALTRNIFKNTFNKCPVLFTLLSKNWTDWIGDCALSLGGNVSRTLFQNEPDVNTTKRKDTKRDRKKR